MKNNPLVYISVLNWNNYSDTIHCVQLLRTINYSNYKILITDNASVNDSVNQIEKVFPELKVHVASENLGFAGGHEINVRKAISENADLVWIVNSDLEVEPSSLNYLVDAYQKNTNALYGSLVLSSKTNPVVEYLPEPEVNKSIQEISACELIESDYVLGSSMIIPTKIIKEEGFIKTWFFLYAEEVDYAYELKKKGIISYFVPKSIVYHASSSSFKLSSKLKYVKSYYLTRNTLYFLNRHHRYSRRTIARMNGGIWHIFFQFIQVKKDEAYYKYLGIIHFLLGIKGKRIHPEDFL